MIPSFYDSGHQDGFAHGRIHGLIEGRALGREKGFEMWEEIGFYEGFALTWRAILRQQSKEDEFKLSPSWLSQIDLLSDLFYGSRASQHILHLLEYISQFPRVNPSSSDDAASSPDISKLLRQIRSRYKALCSILGVHARLRSSNEASDDEKQRNSNIQVDTKDAAIPIWKLDKTGAKKTVTNQDLSF